ncbi:glycosyltransferase, partial [Francisella philomiragia]
MNNHIHVAFASDDNYSEPLGVAIYSLVANLDKKKFANIYVLDGGISEQNKSKIVDISFKNFKVKFIYVDPKLYNEYPLYNGDNHT